MKPNMSTLFSIHLPISVATLVPIRNAKWLPVEIRSYQQTIAVNKIQTRKAQTNQQQPTDITQKITNAHEQHELPMNLK